MWREYPKSSRADIASAAEQKRRFLWSIAALLLVVLISALGFDIIGGDEVSFWPEGIWDTLNIISTVGSLPEMSAAERAWAMIVIVVGLSAFLYLYSSLISLLFSGEVIRVYERRRMQRQIESLKNHVIVCGFGNAGRIVVDELKDAEIPVVVVDQQEEAVDAALQKGCFAITGDCTDDEVLKQAGLERARSLVAALDSDAANVFVTLTARVINSEILIVARAENESTVSKLEKAGADRVTVPGRIAALHMSHFLLKPAVTDFIIDVMRGAEFEMRELAVSDYPWMAGKTLVELNLPRKHEIIVVALYRPDGSSKRAGYAFNPSPDERLDLHDTLLVVSRPESYDRLKEKN